MVGKNGESLPPLSQRVPAVPCRGPPASEGGRLGPVWPPPGPCLDPRPVSGLLWWPRSPVFLTFAPVSAWDRSPGSTVKGNLIGGAPFVPLLWVSVKWGDLASVQWDWPAQGVDTSVSSDLDLQPLHCSPIFWVWVFSCCTGAQV